MIIQKMIGDEILLVSSNLLFTIAIRFASPLQFDFSDA
jgi:hypothetical protein